MTEPEFTALLTEMLEKGDSGPDLSRVVTEGIVRQLPEPARTKLAAPLINWRLVHRNHPYVLIGPPRGPAVALLEVASMASTTDFTTLKHFRAMKEQIADRSGRKIWGNWTRDTLPQFDEPHFPDECAATGKRCELSVLERKDGNRTGRHIPVVSRADAYRAVAGYLHPDLRTSSAALVHVLLAPNESSLQDLSWQTDMHGGRQWHVAYTKNALAYWTLRQGSLRNDEDSSELAYLVHQTELFLTRTHQATSRQP